MSYLQENSSSSSEEKNALLKMNNNMRVSVVMAGRNSKPDLLKEAINSILNQTYQDIEFIFVDDGSEEPMEPVVRAISSDPRIAVYRIVHSGLGAALNYGINHSCGEYIARIDDDDLMLPTRLEKQVAFLNRHLEVSCVGTWFYDKVRDKCLPHRAYPVEHKKLIEDLLNLHWGLAHTTVMFRREAFDKVGGYRISGGGQDLDLFLQLGTVGKLANVNEYLTCYTMSANGLGSINPKKKEAYIFALNDVVERNLYPAYVEIAKLSIRRLKKEKKSVLRTRLIRTLMVWRVKLFGKDIFNVDP